MADSNLSEHLNFFKDLAEGRANMHFSRYLKMHEDSLKEHLPRSSFLRLKFEPIKEIRKILSDHKIPFKEDDVATRKEEYLISFHADVLDENGELSQEHKNKIFNGAVKSYHESNYELARKKLYSYIGFPKNLDQTKSIEKIKDVITFASIEGMHGDAELGKFLLRSLSQIDRQLSEIDDFILQAASELKKLEAA